MTPEHFQALRAPGGSLAVGDPQEVADKLMDVRRELGADRVLLHLSVGTMAHEKVLRAVELLGTEVAPAVRGQPAGTAASAGSPEGV